MATVRIFAKVDLVTAYRLMVQTSAPSELPEGAFPQYVYRMEPLSSVLERTSFEAPPEPVDVSGKVICFILSKNRVNLLLCQHTSRDKLSRHSCQPGVISPNLSVPTREQSLRLGG